MCERFSWNMLVWKKMMKIWLPRTLIRGSDFFDPYINNCVNESCPIEVRFVQTKESDSKRPVPQLRMSIRFKTWSWKKILCSLQRAWVKAFHLYYCNQYLHCITRNLLSVSRGLNTGRFKWITINHLAFSSITVVLWKCNKILLSPFLVSGVST